MDNNEELYQAAIDAITELFSDKSVSVSDCRANLEGLIEEIKMLLESLPD